jgi:hypothetical protein
LGPAHFDQARIKDVVEVHGRMYLRANPTDAALGTLQSAKNWIRAAVTVIDPAKWAARFGREARRYQRMANKSGGDRD